MQRTRHVEDVGCKDRRWGEVVSVKTFWMQALGVVGGHHRLLGWWWLSGLSRVMVGVLGLLVVVSVVMEMFGGGIAGVLALWARRGTCWGMCG